MISKNIKLSLYGLAPTDEDTDQTAFSKLNSLYHLRHDLFLEMANFCLFKLEGKSSETPLEFFFEEKLPDQFSNLTPDIFFERNDIFYTIDVSVTSSKSVHLRIKNDKYTPFISYLRSQGYKAVDFALFWQASYEDSLGHFLNEIDNYCINNDIPFYMPNSQYITSLKLMFSSMNDYIAKLKIKCPDLIGKTESLLQDPRTFRENYPKYSFTKKTEQLIGKLKDSTLESAEKYFNKLVKDEEVIGLLSDSKHSSDMYEESFSYINELETKYPKGKVAPTLFIPYAEFEDKKLLDSFFGNAENPYKMPLEQHNAYLFLKIISQLIEDESAWLLRKLFSQLDECLSNNVELNLFNSGLFTGNLDEENIFNLDYRKVRLQDSSVSRREFYSQLNKETEVRTVLPQVFRNKSLKIEGFNNRDAFLMKSGTAYRKTHEVRKYKDKTTIPQNYRFEFDKFIDLLEEDTNSPHKLSEFLGSDPGPDLPSLVSLKKLLISNHRNFLNLIQKSKCHSFMKHTNLISSQLLHFTEMNTTDNVYSFMNSGMKNVLHIVRGGSLQRGNDIGQAFFTIFVTDDIRWCNKIYGECSITKLKLSKPIYIVRTPWVRLSSERLSFMRDQYASVLSTSYDTWARNKPRALEDGFFRHMYSFRSIVSSCPSQKVAELLMDTRYIFMSSLSLYSNVAELIKEKFAPPYKNLLEQYIVHNLRKKCGQVVKHLEENPPKKNVPTFDSNKRLHHSLGGKITIPSLWSTVMLNDIQSVFDDIFVYVHTSKEPSSEYHEQIKAINTILQFQRIYDNFTEKQQNGIFTAREFKQLLRDKITVGCNSNVILQSSKLFSSKYEYIKSLQSFNENCIKEPLGNITSTKSCIPEVLRTYDVTSRTEKKHKQVLKNIEMLNTIRDEVDITSVLKEQRFIRVNFDVPNIVISNQGRAKVHDCILEWLKKYKHKKPNYVMDLALWNVFENNSRVIADTCIKSQYGAKREFYVINLGAKAMARVVENGYKELAKACKNEMISVPGDQKLKHIQESLDSAIFSSQRKQDTLLFVNGDCTKWSACETMASFISMTLGLSSCFGDEFTGMALATFDAWSNKQIQIPNSILQNLSYISEKTSYVDESCVIKSTQNFLQGMFNYSSSIKSVIATDFAIHMFKKNNPGTFLICNHLEHSDDYTLVVRCKSLEEFEKFRVYHKLSQRLHGINDSIKKTNIQPHILEFISLFSFNGQLYYPNIKKTKEVGTNLSCEDFKSDVMSISSRVSESCRIGVSLESSYFMQRVHCMTIAEAYSLSPGMRNGFKNTVELFSTPLELFGFPDCLPICSLICKGSSENYRLYNFASEEVKKSIEKLYGLNQYMISTLDFPTVGFKDEISDFFTPKFSYKLRKQRLKAIREKLSMTIDQAVEYFEKNITDTLLKPVDTSRLEDWLCSMYFNRSFGKAYTKISRASMCLRHSNYSSKPCILNPFSKAGEPEYFTIMQYIDFFNTRVNEFNFGDPSRFNRCLSCYNSNLELLYKYLSNCAVIEINEFENVKTTVNPIPEPYRWFKLENNVSHVLQKYINPINFNSDRRKYSSETSLNRDKNTLMKYFDLEHSLNSRFYLRQVFKECILQNSRRAFCLSFSADVSDMSKYIKQFLELGSLYNKQFKLIPRNVTEIQNPLTGAMLFSQDWKTNQNSQTSILYQLALFYRLVILSTVDKKLERSQMLNKLLKAEILDWSGNVELFLNQTTIESLEMIKCGENSKKILSFLKYRLLDDIEEIKSFVTSKFYYEVSYKRNNIPGNFSEQVNIKFLSSQYHAYLLETHGRKTVFLETKNVNKTYIFYAYSMAQRAFGIISQVELDARLMESKDFKIPKIDYEIASEMECLILRSRIQIYLKIVNKTIIETSDLLSANLPVIIQNFRYNYEIGKKMDINSYGNISLHEFTVMAGRTTLFKLPFGNIYYGENRLKFSEDFKIGGISMNYIAKTDGLLMSYLKTDKSYVLPKQIGKAELLEIGECLKTEVPGSFSAVFQDDLTYVPQYREVKKVESYSSEDSQENIKSTQLELPQSGFEFNFSDFETQGIDEVETDFIGEKADENIELQDDTSQKDYRWLESEMKDKNKKEMLEEPGKTDASKEQIHEILEDADPFENFETTSMKEFEVGFEQETKSDSSRAEEVNLKTSMDDPFGGLSINFDDISICQNSDEEVNIGVQFDQDPFEGFFSAKSIGSHKSEKSSAQSELSSAERSCKPSELSELKVNEEEGVEMQIPDLEFKGMSFNNFDFDLGSSNSDDDSEILLDEIDERNLTRMQTEDKSISSTSSDKKIAQDKSEEMETSNAIDLDIQLSGNLFSEIEVCFQSSSSGSSNDIDIDLKSVVSSKSNKSRYEIERELQQEEDDAPALELLNTINLYDFEIDLGSNEESNSSESETRHHSTEMLDFNSNPNIELEEENSDDEILSIGFQFDCDPFGDLAIGEGIIIETQNSEEIQLETSNSSRGNSEKESEIDVVYNTEIGAQFECDPFAAMNVEFSPNIMKQTEVSVDLIEEDLNIELGDENSDNEMISVGFQFDYDPFSDIAIDVGNTIEIQIPEEVQLENSTSISEKDEEESEIEMIYNAEIGAQFECDPFAAMNVDFSPNILKQTEIDDDMIETKNLGEIEIDNIDRQTENKGMLFKIDNNMFDLNEEVSIEELNWKEQWLEVTETDRRAQIYFDQLDNIHEEELFEYIPIENYESSDSGSNDSEEPVYYQWSNNINRQPYNFDVKCRENMLSLHDFLIEISFRRDFEEICSSSKGYTDLMKTLYKYNSYKFSKKGQRFKPDDSDKLRDCLCFIISKFLVKLGKQEKDLIRLTRQKAFRIESEKIVFYKIDGFRDLGDAIEHSLKRTNVRTSSSMRFNNSYGIEKHWTYQPLKIRDILAVLNDNSGLDYRLSNGTVNNILDTLKYLCSDSESELSEDYD